MPSPFAPTVTAYYTAMAPALLAHLAGRQIRGLTIESDGDAGDSGQITAPASTEQVLALASTGVVGFLTTPAGRIAMHLTPGDGADIATAATAALQIAEQCASDGLQIVPMTDGQSGLWLLARTDGDPSVAGARYAELLTRAAPELATVDAAQCDGRSLLTLHGDARRPDVPVPYTLLPGQHGLRAAIPLHLDEVAAVTAGMPAEWELTDAPERLGARGDLAAPLLDGSDRVV